MYSHLNILLNKEIFFTSLFLLTRISSALLRICKNRIGKKNNKKIKKIKLNYLLFCISIM